MPRAARKGFRPLRTQNRKAVAAAPITTVGQFVAPMLAASEDSRSGRVSPSALMPRMYFTWLAAIRMPDAVMKPEMTGCDRKLAMKPRRKMPMASNMAPERKASTTAAAATSAALPRPSLPIAAAVISETTATGPTASARLVPNTA